MGAATADAFYGFIVAFGLTFLSNLMISSRDLLNLVGGLFLLYLGIKTLFSRPATEAANVDSGRRGLIGMYLSTLFLTITNPVTILSFLAIFAGAGIASVGEDYVSAGVIVLGVFGGSALWWLTLSSAVSFFRSRFNEHVMRWVNRLSGLVMIGFALWVLF